ncbi:hypothetical protein ACIHFE_33730 [Streptomyces sp. NPDC052396]|uniref:hypothetical protein n=1 Tax=Streptomyces sp. NPDC052396 TaxID=3365689 RepID=UPI0037D804E8
MLDLAHAVASHTHLYLADDIPNPGTGTTPPHTKGLVLILQWVAWAVCGVCVAGLLIVAGRMALMHQRGEGGQHMTGLAYVMGACVIVGSASALVGALVTAG